MKKGFIVLLTCLLLCFCVACGAQTSSGETEDDSEEEEVVTYDMLSENGKEVVDFIYQNRDTWSDKCTSVNFGTSDGQSIFYVWCYANSSSGQYKYEYNYDVQDGTFKKRGSTYYLYSYVVSSKSAEDKLRSITLSSQWDDDWSEAEKKDYIALKYAASLD